MKKRCLLLIAIFAINISMAQIYKDTVSIDTAKWRNMPENFAGLNGSNTVRQV